MTTPNLDANWHLWVESLAVFTFSIEYQKGWDNVAADTLGPVTLKLDAETVKSILDGITMGITGRVDAQDPAVAEADEEIHKPVQEIVILARAIQAHVNLHVTDWMTIHQKDPVLNFFNPYGLGLRSLPHLYVYTIGLSSRPSYIFPFTKTAHKMGK